MAGGRDDLGVLHFPILLIIQIKTILLLPIHLHSSLIIRSLLLARLAPGILVLGHWARAPVPSVETALKLRLLGILPIIKLDLTALLVDLD